MKLLLGLMLIAHPGLVMAGIPQNAIDFFARKNRHNHPNTAQIIEVDFRGDGSPQFLMTFVKGDGDWYGGETFWTLIEFKEGQWSTPKWIDEGGTVWDEALLDFDPNASAFVYLPSYKRNGLLEHAKRFKLWTFTYFEKNILNTLFFWDPADVGLTGASIEEMIQANKVTVIQNKVP